MTRLMRICTSIAAATLATACAAHGTSKAGTGVATPDGSTDPAAPPISGALGVSVGDGPPGTVITLHAIRCLTRGSKPDEIIWQDSAHAGKGGELLTHVLRSGNELQTTFTVPTNAPAGLGFFETYCGAKSTGAMAGFTVDPP